MNAWNKYLIVFIAVTLFPYAYAQVESAPQEPPYVQEENEFDTSPATKQADEESLSIEDELKSIDESEKKETAESKKKQDTEKKVEEELSLPDASEPVAEEPAVIPAETHPIVQTPQLSKPKIVRQSKKGNVEYIEHPLAAKGLTTITKEGAYIYKTHDIPEENKTGIIRFGSMDPPKIKSADGLRSFDSMYSKNQQSIIMFDYEWHPFSQYGKLGVQAGVGMLIAYGNGRFVSDDPLIDNTEAKEKYTFLALPLNLGVVYRLEWMERQWFAPYVSGGVTYIPVVEIRDDGKTPSAIGTPGAYGSGGMLFNISAINRSTAFTLKSEYGITNLWVSLEYRYLQTFNDELDFSTGIVGAGVAVDY